MRFSRPARIGAVAATIMVPVALHGQQTPTAAPAAPAAQTPRKWTVDDVLAMKTVSGVTISPDGKRVAYVVTTADREANANRFRSRMGRVWTARRSGRPTVPGWPFCRIAARRRRCRCTESTLPVVRRGRSPSTTRASSRSSSHPTDSALHSSPTPRRARRIRISRRSAATRLFATVRTPPTGRGCGRRP